MKKEKNLGCGPRIKTWRKGIPMKSFELAKLIKISQGSLSDIENGKSNPSANTIVNFLKYTEINTCWLLTGKSAEFDIGETIKAPLTIHLNKSEDQVLIKRID